MPTGTLQQKATLTLFLIINSLLITNIGWLSLIVNTLSYIMDLFNIISSDLELKKLN